MKHWSVVWVLALPACSIPSLEELQSERPRACDEQHACGAGQVCISGACRESPCGSRTPTVAYADMDRDGYAAVGAAPRVFCEGVPSGYVTVLGDCDDSNADVHPLAAEACNGRDDNCDGVIDDGLPTRPWFLDADQDGFGRNTPALQACARPGPQYVDITGDCDDERADVHPGAAELCNGVDDNCDGAVDEPFKQGAQALGTECVAICTGTYACNVAQTGTVCVAPAATSYYPDEDGDGEGQKDSEPVAAVCPGQAPPPLMAANTLDCDDHDSATNTQGTEVCDGLDNDCDGEVDELMSCGSLKMVEDPALVGRQWRTVAVHPKGYPLWLAGMGGKLAVKRAPESPFVSHDGDTPTGCGPQGNTLNWHAAWVNPANGHVFLAGQDGWLAEHDGGSCIRLQQFNLPGSVDFFSGVVGVGEPLQIFAVSTRGELYEWKANPLHADIYGRYWGLHALGQDSLYAVGSTNELEPLNPSVNLHTRQGWNAPVDQNLQGTAGYNGSLRAVWAANTSLIYAVGDAGLVVKGSGQSRDWERVLPPVRAAVNYTSVAVPPETENAYIIGNDSNGGRLHRLTLHGWAKAPAFTPSAPDVLLRDIAMTSAGDFWIVGDDGRVYHFPEP